LNRDQTAHLGLDVSAPPVRRAVASPAGRAFSVFRAPGQRQETPGKRRCFLAPRWFCSPLIGPFYHMPRRRENTAKKSRKKNTSDFLFKWFIFYRFVYKRLSTWALKKKSPCGVLETQQE
jgi:hypothetical protein